MNRLISVAVGVALFLIAIPWSLGAVVNERLYRLGEDDPGAVALNPGDDPTRDHYNAANDAGKIGLTYYYGKSGFGGPPVSLGLVPGSSFSMEFTNIDSRYVAPAALSSVTENFGMEAYIQVGVGVTDARAFYNGGDGTPLGTLTRGYGLGISGGQYAAIVGGSVFVTPVAALPTQPVEMALVNTGAGNFTVYIQDVPVMNFAVALVSPPAAGDVLSLGNFYGNYDPPGFSGVIDEARLFTFAPGGFDSSTDLGPSAVPEPTCVALLASGGGAVLAWHLARRRRGIPVFRRL
jgi:hypothetical protein